MKHSKLLIILSISAGMLLSSCGVAINKFIVVFNSNGGSTINSQIVEGGGFVERHQDPTRAGYTFVNWTYQGKEWLFNEYTVTQNMKLDANWNPVVYSITYNLDGGDLSTENPNTYTIEDNFPLNSPTKRGYTFTGWFDEKENKVTSITAGMYGNLNLKAYWSANIYKVNVINVDETKGLVSGSGEYAYGNEVAISALNYENYAFKGWYSDEECTRLLGKSSVYKFIMSDEDVTIYAKFWSEEEGDAWDKAHAVKPVLSEDGKTITYGLYPQSNVNDPSLLSELNSITEPEFNGWYLYNDTYYTKTVSKPYIGTLDNYFSNGTKVQSGVTYWFKCEPIVWDVLNATDGTYFITSRMLLDCHRYAGYTDSFQYNTSEVRYFLNNDFYNKAFILGNSNVLTSEVRNGVYTTNDPYGASVGPDTFDKVFLLSYKDYHNADYGYTGVNLKSKATDWVRAVGGYCSGYYGTYLTRSPNRKLNLGVSFVNTYGWINDNVTMPVESEFMCLRPSLNINF